jgi:hypothetical protein
MSLSHQLAERRKDNEDPDCVVEALSTQSPGFVEFFDRPLSRQGFALSHLLHYRLAPREAAGGDGADAAPQVLTLAFSTADVVVTGWCLERVAEKLSEGKLVAVKTIPARHLGLTGNRPAVVAIEIRAVSPGKGGL